MNCMRIFLAAAFILLFLAATAPAMEIQKYDSMSGEDRKDYFGLLLQGAGQVLQDQGRTADAQKVEKLFSTTMPGDRDILGVLEFERNLALLRQEDAHHALAHPNDPRPEVEDAMAATLHMNGIELPDTFYKLASLRNFRPRSEQAKKK